eukprot:CAMPEP_0117673760 /NCGR_PEP_ID=MMETSP0804-20121206/14653_1 /TAXON_ID=1074897 /ORGANISM="Tetraselmis astigmatica, Strain CCMP880" /LENGTH=344 /DNA_ID=CAMNT_0005482537 /DNA_START=239 /DNA_END=1273 /DNA_ORIENTATION=+
MGSQQQISSPYVASPSGRLSSGRAPSVGGASAYSGYMGGNSVLLEKRARKAAEEDALRLYNRVRQLQKEEEKARKRIDETRKRADEIQGYRERNLQKHIEKAERLEAQLDEIEAQRIANLEMKDQSIKLKQKNEEMLVAQKMELAAQVKDEREEIERQVAEDRLVARRTALQKKEEVKKSEAAKQKKLSKLQQEKLRMASEEYEKKLQQEVQARLKKEKELAKMAKLEAELIARLKRKQVEQADAYRTLEMALGMSADPVAKDSPVIQTEGGQDGEPSEEEIAQRFSVFDEDGSGHIDCKYLGDLMQQLRVPLNPHQLNQAIMQLDRDNTGQISFGEFLLWWRG